MLYNWGLCLCTKKRERDYFKIEKKKNLKSNPGGGNFFLDLTHLKSKQKKKKNITIK